MTSPPTSKNIRLTITVTPEVHQTFQRLAKASNMSISRAMGEWLGDTLEAAEFLANKVEQARAAPGLVMRELQALALGTADELGTFMDQIRQKGVNERGVPAKRGRVAGSHPSPPSGNTGGKGQTDKQAKRGSKS